MQIAPILTRLNDTLNKGYINVGKYFNFIRNIARRSDGAQERINVSFRLMCGLSEIDSCHLSTERFLFFVFFSN